MIPVNAYAAYQSKEPLKPYKFERRDPGPHDVQIDIHFCGVCHSDLHQVRDEWGGSKFPMVPGHEIVGKVISVGSSVKKFKAGDSVGVGCLVDSCRTCPSCGEGLEQYCENGSVGTYNSVEKDGVTVTQGGYSTQIVVNEDFVLKISPKLPLDKAAPLLCAGITTYSPLRHWKAGPGKKVAVMGLGGLGHMAVKLAAAMGAEVTVLSSSNKKKDDAHRLGAHNYAATSEQETFKKYNRSFDLIINTVSAPIDLGSHLQLLKRDGTMVLLGVPDKPEAIHAFPLIGGRRSLAGSLIGGIKETQEMLDFCAEHGITSDIELINIDKINESYERMLKGDVRYRFVIDIASLK
ncbi:NAD(P)-dependent alcohol dehydrogenase [Bdellovibrio bacteriovorus]|uniref:NAD(P)-dependent alcohol dehydrogenase n=1 Tax=Bdellovibrio bacteriovorus TaxID=959 RepID=UPI0021D36580|nr:NAD(P)-dependent alcohol dehydrogenase [Bdellovibrio bacteriovorus]UXR64716.1 NAD(P)-dependent alcohol dehydrogenase [Bdellovibrio bacteriovorus]